IITEELPSTGGLQLLEASVDDLQVEEQVTGPCVTGIRLADGSLVKTASVVITTGTFLRGRLLLGDSTSEGGRMGERPSGGIARTFERLNVQLGRMKTGTPPRLDGRTIDWGRNIRFPERQLSCHMAFTNEETHRIVRDNRHLAPKHTGAEPRYCPSIDSKVVRFADKESHQKGRNVSVLPALNVKMVQSIAGVACCKGACCCKGPGYAVEYDYVLPSQLDHSLAVRCAKGLFLAGQINGTTGYEEAAAQIKLLLRADNADIRLSHLALAAGALSEGRDAERLATLRVRAKALGDVELALKAVVHSPDQWSKLCGLHVSKNGVPRSGWDLLGSGGAEAPALLTSMRESGLAIPDLESELEKQLLVTARYDPYIRRSQAQLTELELSGYKLPLPSGIDYDSLTELSGEERERLRRERPGTVGAAAALEGITATGMSVLLRQARRSAAAGAGATREMTR
ncbi:glucose inhibited division protein A-domain-containing protein, partial [Pavlovales sp. CCMP2436]